MGPFLRLEAEKYYSLAVKRILIITELHAQPDIVRFVRDSESQHLFAYFVSRAADHDDILYDILKLLCKYKLKKACKNEL